MNLNEFDMFISKYQKRYVTETDRYIGYMNYKTNMEIIRQKNQRQKNYRLGVNQFSDHNMQMMNRRILSNDFSRDKPDPNFMRHPMLSLSLDTNMDWEKNGYVHPIKNQGNCGSCWAFSTISALETMIHYYMGIQEELSEQQLIDCSEENYGCEGGWMHTALEYIKEQKGVVPSSIYPYISKQQKCQDVSEKKIKESSWFHPYFVVPNSPESLKTALSLNSICVAVYADFDFVFYQEGIFDPIDDSNHALNHAVVMIGYDKKNQLWRIRNSWGKTWGEDGYMRLPIREGKGVAGIHSYGIFPMFHSPNHE